MDWKAGLDNPFWDVLRKRNLLLLVLFWLMGLVVLVSYGRLRNRPRHGAPCVGSAFAALEANETGAVVAQRQAFPVDPNVSYRVTFDNLCAENGAAGVFRTAYGKHVRIENLHVVFVRSEASLPSGADDDIRLSSFCDLFSPRRGGRLEASEIGILDEFAAHAADWSTGLDLANAMEVQIRNLDWEIRDGRAVSFRVQCRHARLQGGAPRIVLRGRVVVRTHGATLESNHIEMNVRDECFVVRGRYRLTRDGRREARSGMRFDRTLEPVTAQPSNPGEDGKWASGLPHGAF